jgi:hypothetical protein
MVHDEVLVPNRLEAVAAELADPLRDTRIVGREPEIRPLVDDHLRRVGKPQAAALREHVAGVDADEVAGRVSMLTDGRFLYSGGIWGGQYGEMGPTAKFVSGSAEILIATHPTYDWADEQYRSMGMDPSAAKFFVAKNPMNYRVAYEGRYKEAFVLDTPRPHHRRIIERRPP